MEPYRAPRWLIGGNAQTIWPALFSKRFDGPPLDLTRTRWKTPDGDFIDVDRASGDDAEAPLLVLFHGLEGSSASHYAQAFGHRAHDAGWGFAVPHFRGCSGELNLAPRAYHSGDFEEIGWVLDRLRAQHRGRMVAVGVSLGGNALLRWAEEAGDSAAGTVGAVAAVSSPIDLAAGGRSARASTGRSTHACSCAR